MSRIWQSSMIALARSGYMKRWAQRSRAGSVLATRYVAGGTLQQAVESAVRMHRDLGIRASLFYLGEYVDSPALVVRNVEAKIATAEALGRAGLDVHVSVDPTQIGFLVDREDARRNAFAIADAVARAAHRRPGFHALMLDMEDQSLVDETIALHDEIRREGLPVAITLQTYLRRTPADIRRCVEQGAAVRLVKGAFAAGHDVAYTARADMDAAWRHSIDMMFGPDAKASGCRPIIGTHDHRVQDHASRTAAAAGWGKGEYEFEMLMGVRQELATRQAARGEQVRLYVPYGEDWWPHALRRIGENPANGWLLARSLLWG